MLFRKSPRSRRQARDPPKEPFHAVSIVPRGSPCDACVLIEGRRFLSREAPLLPMPGCTADCRCIYRHHADRRERSLLSRYFAESTGQPERRH